MPVEVLRSVASRNRGMLNFFVALACGGWIIWDESLRPDPNQFWYVLGGVFILWAGVIFWTVMRPLMMRVDEGGILVQGIFRTQKIGWDALSWMDMTRPRSIILAYDKGTAGQVFALVSRSMAQGAALEQACAAILARKPGLPTHAPVIMKGKP